jgi:hypothetical protein
VLEAIISCLAFLIKLWSENIGLLDFFNHSSARSRSLVEGEEETTAIGQAGAAQEGLSGARDNQFCADVLPFFKEEEELSCLLRIGIFPEIRGEIETISIYFIWRMHRVVMCKRVAGSRNFAARNWFRSL